jgi:hypothetical protein
MCLPYSPNPKPGHSENTPASRTERRLAFGLGVAAVNSQKKVAARKRGDVKPEPAELVEA